MSTEPLFRPTLDQIRNSAMYRFSQQLAGLQDNDELNFQHDEAGAFVRNYEKLHRYSVNKPGEFWRQLWRYSDIIGELGSAPNIDNPKLMPGASWFADSQVNFAENLLRHRNDNIAIIAYKEHGGSQRISYNELYLHVAQLASAMRKQGIKPGDPVAGIVANCPEAIIAMLATASLGAVWSSCSPDFGIKGILDRFSQIQPKLLFCVNAYYYNGKVQPCLAKLNEVTKQLPSVQKTIAIDYCESNQSGDFLYWHEFVDTSATLISFYRQAFKAPLYIMYSSGTTGQPKCIVHGQGGTLLQHVKEHLLHLDLSSQDVIFYYTTCGWMMWNWLVSALVTGATLVLYDGSPFHPQPQRLFDLIDDSDISVFGSSAKFYSAVEKAQLQPANSHRLSKLRSILSTGSPLAPESYDFVYKNIKSDVCLSSISGGTDILSCFVLGNPWLPVYRGEIQCIGLGMDVQVLNDQGQPCLEQKGELVCASAFPCMPIGFWNDSDGSKFHQAYFAQYANVWCQGDYAEITKNKGLIIHGRSDAVLNPGGVRIGTAEIYRQVEKLDQVVESIAIGQSWRNDVRVILFVRLRDNIALTTSLIQLIKTTIRTNTTPRHVPAKVIAISDIPRTISGKIVELAVRNVVHGITVKNRSALANPNALELYKDLPELQK